MSNEFWIMFANFCIMSYIAFSNMKEKNALRKERSELLKKNCDLRDEVHHLKVKYGELPVPSWVMTETNGCLAMQKVR